MRDARFVGGADRNLLQEGSGPGHRLIGVVRREHDPIDAAEFEQQVEKGLRKPGNQPGNQPGSQPGNQPGSQPGNQPGSQPGSGGGTTVRRIPGGGLRTGGFDGPTQGNQDSTTDDDGPPC